MTFVSVVLCSCNNVGGGDMAVSSIDSGVVDSTPELVLDVDYATHAFLYRKDSLFAEYQNAMEQKDTNSSLVCICSIHMCDCSLGKF